jgi:hypothetical protein
MPFFACTVYSFWGREGEKQRDGEIKKKEEGRKEGRKEERKEKMKKKKRKRKQQEGKDCK